MFAIEHLIQDVRVATRSLLRRPAFVMAALLSLTLGIAGNTVIFTFAKAAFLPHLPVQDSTRLVLVYSTTRNQTGQVVEYQSTSYLNAKDYRDRNRVFESLAIIVDSAGTLEVGGRSTRALVNLVNQDYFDVLGVTAARGRTIAESDEAVLAAPVIVVSDAIWKGELGGNKNVLGTSLHFNHHEYIVIGVMPPEFRNIGGLPAADVWIPAMWHEQVLVGNIREWYGLRATRVASMVARLKPGASVSQAQQAMTAIGAELQIEYPKDNGGRNVMVVPLEHTVVPPSQRRVYVRAGIISATIVGIVLLIACSNVANLLLGHALRRRHEFGVRAALGASRAAIMRLLLVEGVLLAISSCGLGLLVAKLGRGAITRLLPAGLPSSLDFSFDSRVVLFTIAISVLATLMFAVWPAIRASERLGTTRPDWIESRFSRRLGAHSFLVAAQIGLALVAVVTAALFIRSLRAAEQANLGIDLQRQVIASVDLTALGYEPSRARQFFESITMRLRALPSVASVAVGDTPPLSGSYRRTVFPADVDSSDTSNGRLAGIMNIEPGFISTVGMRLLRGRDFSEQDAAENVPVAVINEAAAASLWPGQDPIGKRLRLLLQDWDIAVVGVVNTVTYRNIGEAPQPIIYMPFKQHLSGRGVIYVRARDELDASSGAVRLLMAEIEPRLASTRIRSGEEILEQALLARRVGAELLTAFGGLALLLAVLGTYSVVSYTVAQGRREIGIRVAVGGTRRVVFAQLFLRNMKSVAAGLLIGLFVGALVTSTTANMLYGIGVFDPAAFSAAAALLLTVACIACAVPIWRAINVNPVTALRPE